MIISHSKRFIFIHLYKTAGTSISNYLGRYSNSIYSKRSLLLTYLKLNPRIFSEDFPKHISMPSLKNELDPNLFNSYYKFCFVRNPWDWQVSLYHYILKDLNNPHHQIVSSFNSFSEYLNWRVNYEIQLQYDMIFSEGKSLADYIGKVESLENDLRKICEVIRIPIRNIPKLNVSQRNTYQNYYSQKDKELIADYYKKDIETFDYEF